jgi:hypothetical protein
MRNAANRYAHAAWRLNSINGRQIDRHECDLRYKRGAMSPPNSARARLLNAGDAAQSHTARVKVSSNVLLLLHTLQLLYRKRMYMAYMLGRQASVFRGRRVETSHS